MINRWTLIVLLIVLMACNSNADHDGPSIVKDEGPQIKAAIVDFSRFLASGNTDSLRKICSSQIIILEEGKFYDLPALEKSVTSALSYGTMSRTPNDISLQQRENIAWAHYRVTGEFKSQAQTIPLNLLETVVLEKTAGQWKIVQSSTLQAAPNQ